MKLSEVSLENVKQAIRVDYTFDDVLIKSIMDSAKGYLRSRTELADEELDSYPEMVHAFICLCNDMYSNRETEISSGKPNPTVEIIIGMHRRNYL